MKVAWKKLSAILLAAVLLLAGCNTGNTSWVYSYNGQQVSAGMYIAFMMDGLAELEAKDREANAENTDYDISSLKQLMKVQADGMSGEAWIQNNAYEKAQQYFWTQQTFEAMGLTLSEDETNAVRNTISSFWGDYGSYYENNGVSQASLEAYQLNAEMRQKIFDQMYGPGGQFEVSEDSLKAEFTQDYAKADYLFINKAYSEAEDGTSAEDYNAQQQATANEYLQKLTSGEAEIEDLIYEQMVSTSSDPEETAEIQRPNKGDYTIVVTREWATLYGEDFIDGIFETPVGQARVVETDTYYMLVNRYDILADPDDFENRKSSFLEEKYAESFQEYVKEQAASISPDTNSAAVSRYKPSKIKEQA